MTAGTGGTAADLFDAARALAEEFWLKAKTIEANPFGTGEVAAADIGRAIAYRDASKRLLAVLADIDDDARAEAGEDWNAPDRERDDEDDDPLPASYYADAMVQ